MTRVDPLVLRTHGVLEELQAWQELIGEVADSMRFTSWADRRDWLEQQPTLPPSPLQQLMFAQQGVTLTTLQRVRTPKVAPARVEKPKPAPKRMGRPRKTYEFTPAQLAIAARSLKNQAGQAETKGQAA